MWSKFVSPFSGKEYLSVNDFVSILCGIEILTLADCVEIN